MWRWGLCECDRSGVCVCGWVCVCVCLTVRGEDCVGGDV